jgi:hypothetical protein
MQWRCGIVDKFALTIISYHANHLTMLDIQCEGLLNKTWPQQKLMGVIQPSGASFDWMIPTGEASARHLVRWIVILVVLLIYLAVRHDDFCEAHIHGISFPQCPVLC